MTTAKAEDTVSYLQLTPTVIVNSGEMKQIQGGKWEELIEVEHLLVHNQGRIPTFESKNGKSIIDVTLSYRLPYTLENWRVLRSYNGTDHNTIHYSLKGMEIEIPEHRLYNKTNWDKFTQFSLVLKAKEEGYPPLFSGAVGTWLFRERLSALARKSLCLLYTSDAADE